MKIGKLSPDLLKVLCCVLREPRGLRFWLELSWAKIVP